jgi:hypothetical protein
MAAYLHPAISGPVLGPPGVLEPGQDQILAQYVAAAGVFVIAACLSAFSSAFLLGMFSWLGGIAIHGLRNAPKAVFYILLLVMLLFAAALLQMVLAITVRRMPLAVAFQSLSDLFYLLLTAGWVLGLWLGNFAEIAARNRRS